ncbi:hypothetical protein ACJIZ3_018778 [Penstemon smallii]|uniref:PRA1 family protein n=1 Tax=Penstemon smallii TaxID=265156 RepID=A0ABD3T061_9LAMI
MTTYGTISTTPPSSDTRIRFGIGTRRPWKEMISFSFPENYKIALQRIKSNASYFHVNYAIIVLFMIFLSLLWHPASMIVFLITMAAWLFLYFLRDDPIVIFGYRVDERVILVVLSIFTVVLLLLRHGVVFMVGMGVGLAVVAAHGAFRRINDLGGCDDQERRVDLKETASASFSSAHV